LDPNDKYAWCLKGLLLSRSLKHKAAIECFDKALKLDSTNVHAWTYKAKALTAIQAWQEAEKCINNALKLDPDFEPAKKAQKLILWTIKVKSKQYNQKLKHKSKKNNDIQSSLL